VDVTEPNTAEPPQVLETHISTVVLVGDRALKFMKRIATPFLDQSTIDMRRQACEAELALNRRIAPDVYLGLGHVVENGEITDHFLVMRRMPLDRRLSALVDSKSFAEHVRDVARTVAAFHARQPTTQVAVEMASREGATHLWSSNIDELRDLDDESIDASAIERVATAAQRYLDGREELFTDRIAGGFARDGHGDLLADDIFMLDDGPRVLDCLAFDERLRCGDVLLDIAFLAMDLERLGSPQMAARLLEWYCEFTNEHHPRSLADFYIAYRALVRAKVNVLRARQGDGAAGASARQFLRQCQDHLDAALPVLVLVGGAPGTGKTTVATDLADRLRFTVLSSDEVRKDLVGVAHSEHAYAAPGEGIYASTVTARTYSELIARARAILGMGESVVLDASWTRTGDRVTARRMAHERGALVIELRCDLDPVIAEKRIAARMQTADPSDATPEIAAHMRSLFEPWPESVPIETDGGRDAATEAAVAACRRARGSVA
jgi:uncharacterized protein